MDVVLLNLKDLDKVSLYQAKENIDNEIRQRSQKENEEYRKSKAKYLGKCYEAGTQLIKIIDFDFDNQYSMKCLCFDWSEGINDFIISFDNIGLFCNDYQNPGHQIIELYREISEEEFRAKFNTKINEICFGEFKCQG